MNRPKLRNSRRSAEITNQVTKTVPGRAVLTQGALDFKKRRRRSAKAANKPGQEPEGNRVQSSYISTTAPNEAQQGLQRNETAQFLGAKSGAGAGGGAPSGGGGTTKQSLTKRAKAKYFTRSYVEKLQQLDSPLNYSYTSTLYCAAEMTQIDDKITTTYCNQRWCMVCNRIRIARCINGYMPELSKFQEPFFVTLTVPNVPGAELASTIASMVATWRTVYNEFKRSKQPIQGIRKLECTYNDLEDTYHPHYHFLVEGKAAGERIYRRWLELNPAASPKGQECKPAIPGKLVELFKYFTKIITKSKIDPSGKGTIYIPALDTIFLAMRGHRVFQPFGIKKEVSEKLENLEAQTLETEYQAVIEGMETDMQKELAVTKIYCLEAISSVWQWSQKNSDWINKATGSKLTGTRPAEWVEIFMKGAVF